MTEHDRSYAAAAFVAAYRDEYEHFRGVWDAARLEWQMYVTMPVPQRQPEYYMQAARAKAALDRAAMDWRVRGRKEQYERQLAILEAQAVQAKEREGTEGLGNSSDREVST